MNLEDILYPVPVDEFLRDHWGRVPLHVPGHADKFREVFSLDRFRHLLKNAHRSPDKLPVKITLPAVKGELQSALRIEARQAEEAYRGGATVCVTRIEEHVPELREICDAIRSSLGFQCIIGMNAYWSPDGQGFEPHFDARIASTLQIEGHKTWRYSTRPALAWPGHNGLLDQGRIDYEHPERVEPWENEVDPGSLEGWSESTLAPGDFLCLPAGCWHGASARGASFAINLHFSSVSIGMLMGLLLNRKLGHQPGWRHLPPLLGKGGMWGGKREESEAFLRSRLDEAIACLSALRDDTSGLLLELVSESSSRKELPAASGPWLCLSPFLAVVSHASESECLVLFGGEQMRARGKLAAVLRATFGRKRFHREELRVEGVSPQEVQIALGSLLKAGLLIDAPAVEG